MTKPDSDHPSAQKGQDTRAGDVFTALKEVLGDLGAFCERNVETCERGRSILSSLSERAYHGAKAAYEYLGRYVE
ncbi:DUF5330 domain-containing protein [Bartonella sp. CB178]|uniref:DUF5330 domain-containing protein n=1 Tax=Bartonella sp. CB178 TaxID=3112255 RepID=UPI00300DED9D